MGSGMRGLREVLYDIRYKGKKAYCTVDVLFKWGKEGSRRLVNE
jgi:hypothetical protein